MLSETAARPPRLATISGSATLKARTRNAHAAVDGIFSRFDLGEADGYVKFLLAHARVLPGIEAVLRHGCLPAWQPRTSRLAHDLSALGHDLPAPVQVGADPGLARQVGLLYVTEGSRLGGRLLLRRVRHGFSAQFLAAIHGPGAWRAFTRAVDARADTEGAAWLEEAVDGALHGFQLYATAAEEVLAGAR
jgi:heme oxygenase